MTPSAFSRLFRRPPGTASVEYGFFAAVIAVGLLTILGSIGGPMRVEIAPDDAASTSRRSAEIAPAAETGLQTAALRPAPETAPAPAPARAAAELKPAPAPAPDAAMPALAATEAAMEAVEDTLAAGSLRSDIAAHDAAFEKLIQSLLIAETEAAAARATETLPETGAPALAAAPAAFDDIPADETRTAGLVDWTGAADPAGDPAAGWIPATGFLPESPLTPMPRPERLAAN